MFTKQVLKGLAVDIYLLAKAINKEELRLLFIHNPDKKRGVQAAKRKAIMLLAAENNKEAVSLLIDQFKVPGSFAAEAAASHNHKALVDYLVSANKRNVKYAVRGARRSGYQSLLDNLLSLLLSPGENLNDAIEYAAASNNIVLIETLQEKGASLDVAIEAAAEAGHVGLVNQLLLRKGSLSYAIKGAGAGGHVDLINLLLLQGANHFMLMQGARSHIEGDPIEVLRFIALIDNTQVRRLLAQEAILETRLLSNTSLETKANKLNHLIRKNGLSLNQALGYLTVMTEKMGGWLTHGLTLVADGRIPSEIYFYILTSCVDDCSVNDAVKILKVARTRVSHHRSDLISYAPSNSEFFSLPISHQSLEEDYAKDLEEKPKLSL